MELCMGGLHSYLCFTQTKICLALLLPPADFLERRGGAKIRRNLFIAPYIDEIQKKKTTWSPKEERNHRDRKKNNHAPAPPPRPKRSKQKVVVKPKNSTHRSLTLHPPIPRKHTPLPRIKQRIILHHPDGLRRRLQRRRARRQPRARGPVDFE